MTDTTTALGVYGTHPKLGRLPSPDDPHDWPITRLPKIAALVAAPETLPRHAAVRSAVRYRGRFDQQEGSCVGRSGAGIKIVQERRDMRHTYHFDGLWLWRAAKWIDGLPNPESDRGTYIRAAAKVLADEGIAVEARNRDTLRYRIAGYYRANTLDEIKASIVLQKPIWLASWWFSEWWDTLPDGVLREPNLSHDVGGHATYAFAYDDDYPTWAGKGVVWARNSWSPAWGRNGDFGIPYALLAGGDGRIGSSPFDEAWRIEDRTDL